MNPPIEGMTKRPAGSDFMAPAFCGCFAWAAKETGAIDAFLRANPDCTPPPADRDPISRMIDDACGVRKSIIGKFADWVASEIWGLEGDPAAEELADYAEVMREIEGVEESK